MTALKWESTTREVVRKVVNYVILKSSK